MFVILNKMFVAKNKMFRKMYISKTFIKLRIAVNELIV